MRRRRSIFRGIGIVDGKVVVKRVALEELIPVVQLSVVLRERSVSEGGTHPGLDLGGQQRPICAGSRQVGHRALQDQSKENWSMTLRGRLPYVSPDKWLLKQQAPHSSKKREGYVTPKSRSAKLYAFRNMSSTSEGCIGWVSVLGQSVTVSAS